MRISHVIFYHSYDLAPHILNGFLVVASDSVMPKIPRIKKKPSHFFIFPN